MAAPGIVMRPVENTALGIPLVFSEEGNLIAFGQGSNSRYEIDVVGHQQCLSGIQFQDKPLVPAPLAILRQEFNNDTPPLDLDAAQLFFKSITDRIGMALLMRRFFEKRPFRIAKNPKNRRH